MKPFATRLDADTHDRLTAAAEITGLRPADLLRVGARMVLQKIEDEGGLQLPVNLTPSAAKNTGKLPAHPAIAKAKRAASKPTASTKGARRVA